MNARTIPAHITSAELVEAVNARTYTKAAAVKFITARMDARVATGKSPTFASRKAYNALTGATYTWGDGPKPKAPAKKAPAKKAPAKRATKAPAKAPAKIAPPPADALDAALLALVAAAEALAALRG